MGVGRTMAGLQKLRHLTHRVESRQGAGASTGALSTYRQRDIRVAQIPTHWCYNEETRAPGAEDESRCWRAAMPRDHTHSPARHTADTLLSKPGVLNRWAIIPKRIVRYFQRGSGSLC